MSSNRDGVSRDSILLKDFLVFLNPRVSFWKNLNNHRLRNFSTSIIFFCVGVYYRLCKLVPIDGVFLKWLFIVIINMRSLLWSDILRRSILLYIRLKRLMNTFLSKLWLESCSLWQSIVHNLQLILCKIRPLLKFLMNPRRWTEVSFIYIWILNLIMRLVAKSSSAVLNLRRLSLSYQLLVLLLLATVFKICHNWWPFCHQSPASKLLSLVLGLFIV